MTVYFPGPYTFKDRILSRTIYFTFQDRILYNLITLDYIGKKSVFFCPQMTLRHFPAKKKSRIFHSHIFSTRKVVWIFCPQMTLTEFPKKIFVDFLSTNDAHSNPNLWIFCPQFPDRG